MEYTPDMGKRKNKLDMVAALRKAAKASGLSCYRLAKDSAVDSAAVIRFMNGTRGLSFASASRLAEVLDLELRKRGE